MSFIPFSLLRRVAILGASLCTLSLVWGQQELVLSEFVSANSAGLRDEDGETSDWIEIFNPSTNSVTLQGWHLTDDPSDLTQWALPPVSIAGHGFLIVFASGKDRKVVEGELHTNFALERDGEYLALIRPDDTVASAYAPNYSAQFADVSYGRRLEIIEKVLLAGDAQAALLLPKDNAVDDTWMLPSFDDSTWKTVTGGVGYDRIAPPERPLVEGDASSPSDPIIGTSSQSPQGEEVEKAIDGLVGTKYLNFDKLNAGLTVTLSRGATVVTGLKFTSANDAPNRDPSSYMLSGSNDGVNFTAIASGVIPIFQDRFETHELRVENAIAYAQYRVIFPTVRDAASAVAVQIAEVEFVALIEQGGEAFAEDVTQPGDAVNPTSFNSPSGEEFDKAIDDAPQTKYLNFDKQNAGFTVTPSSGASVVTGLRLTSANDAPGRDPTSFTLAGSNDGNLFTNIAEGPIPSFTDRFQAVQVTFANSDSYLHYRLLFPTIANAGSVAVQIAEVEVLGAVGGTQASLDKLIDTKIDGNVDSAYLRQPFTISTDTLPKSPELRVWYDDGFVAYLNGTEIARSNAPAVTAWNANAPLHRPREEAVQSQRIDLTPFVGLLVDGENLLAIHALNDASDSDSFLLRSEIVDTEVMLGSEAYFHEPTPGGANRRPFIGVVDEPRPSVGRGFYETPFTLALTSETAESRILYTTDGSEPTLINANLYTAPLTIQRTTVLRAAAFRTDWRRSSILTNTYLFASDVLDQTWESALASGLPSNWNGNRADYGLDPRVSLQASEFTSLPSISLALDADDLFGRTGIYANPNVRGDAWEREVSFEWLDPRGDGRSFQEHAGLRIQGGAFRRFDLTLKKSFRLIFRERYGTSRLRHSIFGPEAAQEADSIVLRANGNDAWVWGRGSALYIRDAFAMETMRAMGQVASHSTFAHLYLNGHYWGLYNPAERPDAAFSSIYHGGNAKDWDALNQDSVPDGNPDAWNRLLAALRTGLSSDANYQRVQGNNPDGTRNPEYEVLLDVDNLIDYVMLNFYIGNADWPGRNHWYGRDRMGDEGFQFYPWDSETAVGLHSDVNANRLGVSDSVARPYAAARANAEFRLRFGDRVQKHFFNGGVFHVDPAAPLDSEPAKRFAALAHLVEPAIAAESARWGDQLGNTRFTRAEHWQPELDDLLKNYFPKRSAIVLDQFRAAGLYPAIDAPVLNQHGGKVGIGFALSMSAKAGSIRYTIDGNDPRAVSANALTYTNPLTLQDLTTVKARALQGGKWSALIEATFVVGMPRLVVSEIDFHPSMPTPKELAAGFTDGDDFEFIELYNPGNTSFDLTGVRLSGGVSFSLDGSIAGGSRMVLVKRIGAFQARYGNDIHIAGEYVGNLSNKGEEVRVVAQDGGELLAFTYSDQFPWAAAADGTGASLEFRNSDAVPTLASSWSASLAGPTPGRSPNPRPAAGLNLLTDGNDLVLTFDGDSNVSYEIQVAESLLKTWQAYRQIMHPGAGPITVRMPIAPGAKHRFFRVLTK